MIYDDVVEIIKTKGYEVNFKNVEKLDGLHPALEFSGKGQVHPVLYFNDYDCSCAEVCADEMITRYLSVKDNEVNITTDSIFADWESKVLPVLTKDKPNDNFVFDTYLDLYVCYKINVDLGNAGRGMVAVTKQMVNALGCTETDLAAAALKNLKNVAEPMTFITLNVIKNKDPYNYGGSQLLNTEVFKNMCIKNGLDSIVIIPSSIHELIMMPLGEKTIEEYNAMVVDVNTTEVAPEEVLSDHVYIYTLADNKITY